MRAVRPLLTILVAVCLLLAANAQHNSARAAGDRTLTVEPALILVDVTPGQTQTYSLTVKSGEAMKIDIAPQGLGQAADGGFQILPADQDASAYTARGYIKVAPRSFNLNAGGSKEVKVTIDVPKDVGEGGRYAILQVQGTAKRNDGSSEDANVGVTASIGASVVLTVDGTKQTRQGEIRDISVGDVASGQPLQVTTSFLNTGNYHYGNSPHRMYAAATLKDPSGNAIATSTTPLTSTSLVPTFGRDFLLTVAPDVTLTPGKYRVEVEVGLEGGTLLDSDGRDLDVTEGVALGAEQSPSADGSASSAGGSGGSSDLPMMLAAFLGGSLLAAFLVLAGGRLRRSGTGGNREAYIMDGRRNMFVRRSQKPAHPHQLSPLSSDGALRRRGGASRGAALLAALFISLLATGLLDGRTALAQSATLRIDPQSQTVDAGQTFTVKIVQNSDGVTLGAQTNFGFDPNLVQIIAAEPGAGYRDALFLYGVAEDGTSASIEAAVASANSTGVLRNLTTFLTPGTGAVPAGGADFILITMRARQGVGGKSALGLPTMGPISPVEMIDENGNSLPVSTVGGEVAVVGGAAPPAGATTPTPPVAGASVTPNRATATPKRAMSNIPSGSTGMSVVPASSKVDPGATVKVDLRLQIGVAATGAQADVKFNKDVLEIVSVEAGPSWKKARVFAGTGRQTLEQAIAEANTSGTLKGVGVLFNPGSGSVKPGEDTFLTLTVRGLTDGKSSITLENNEIVDAEGNSIKAKPQNSELTVGSGGGGGISPFLILGGALLVLGLAGGAGFAFVRMRRDSEV